ncbi:MAG: adenylate/guanylate cyclase domain-containing protein, partial [Schleiferiaceae bacterium]|nr:adenylate/guanylate cyclase domain-containing protein [Schleiferiaceae bacterium]
MRKRILIALMFSMICISSYAQKISVDQADSLYTFLDTVDIASDYENTLIQAKKALFYFKSQQDSCKISKLSRKLSRAYEANGMIDSALQVILWSKPHAYACSYRERAFNFIVTSGVYLNLEEFEYVVQISNDFERDWPESAPDSLIYEVPMNKAISLVYLGRTDEAKTIFKEMYYSYVERNKVEQQIDGLNNLGALYGMLGELDSAAYFLEKAAKLCVDIQCKDQYEFLQNLSTLASEMNDSKKAILYIDSALGIARRTNNLAVETELLREIAMANKRDGNNDVAWDFLVEHANLQDTLFSTEIAKALARYREAHENEQKERKIHELEVDKLESDLRESKLRQSRNLYVVLGVVIFILAIALWSRLRYTSRTKKVIEKEKERSEQLLLNILPHEVAQELKEKGESEAKDFENVTVLFSDFQHFTQTAEKLSAKALVQEINTCFKAFDEIMQKYGIEKIKTIGDAYMAAGGLNTPRTAEPVDVVKAGIEMQQFMHQRKSDKEKVGEPFFEMRVGIHTGPVVAGIVGVKKFQYDIWGDTV